MFCLCCADYMNSYWVNMQTSIVRAGAILSTGFGVRINCSERWKSTGCDMQLIEVARCFEGEQRFYKHYSETTKCPMTMTIYLPPSTLERNIKCPVLYFLNGLTATHENFIKKSGFHRFAARIGLCVVSPDTSPRNVSVPGHQILGPSAGFYMDAVQEPWARHYKMYSYVNEELIELVNRNFPVNKDQQSIAGFSMGGMGALISGLRNPKLYKSVSAFAPICNPSVSGLGKIALQEYIGENPEEWKVWDPTILASTYRGDRLPVFVDQGTADPNIARRHLLTENFVCAAKTNKDIDFVYKERIGYDHSHFFVSTFIEEHILYHERHLKFE